MPTRLPWQQSGHAGCRRNGPRIPGQLCQIYLLSWRLRAAAATAVYHMLSWLGQGPSDSEKGHP